ncbi:MAG: hypothetical protein AB8F95_04455 [Bacteroidia bacterium]
MEEDYKSKLEDLSEIRAIMERSTKLISLSGLSGVGAGLVALIGAWVAWRYLMGEGLYEGLKSREYLMVSHKQLYTMIGLALGIMAVAGSVASFFSMRLARKRGLPIWNKTAKAMLIQLSVPLITGAIVCVLLAVYGRGSLVTPATLIFYGLALFSAGQHTHREIQLLGLSEIVLGILGAIYLGYGLLIWAIGFGVLHILYGVVMYFRYER